MKNGDEERITRKDDKWEQRIITYTHKYSLMKHINLCTNLKILVKINLQIIRDLQKVILFYICHK